MIDFVKKTMQMSLGLAFMTKEKVEELASEIVEKGKLSGKESKDFINDLVQKSEETSRKVEAQISETVKKTMIKMNLATQDELSELKSQLAELKETVKKLSEKE